MYLQMSQRVISLNFGTGYYVEDIKCEHQAEGSDCCDGMILVAKKISD